MGRHNITSDASIKMRQMKEEGFSLQEIADVTGYHRSTVCTHLNGKTHQYKYLCKLCGNPTDSELKLCTANPLCKSQYVKEFYKDKTRNIWLKTKYGITEQDFDEMYEAQAGQCAICLKSITKKQSRVDHDHSTGKVRKLLCLNCNVGLGHFLDDPKLLLLAANYLEDHA